MKEAAGVWNLENETLEAVEARIHDGAPTATLAARARGYVDTMFRLFPWIAVPRDGTVVEVGPGVGYIMQALAESTGTRRVTGLDVAPRMIEHAKARIARDRLDPDRYAFILYDGVRFPWPDGSVDFFYSVAAIQHIPKPFAYNVLLEMQRCLKPGSSAAIHLLGWELLANPNYDFAHEIRLQVDGATAHWHHCYDRVELDAVCRHGLKVRNHVVAQEGQAIWVAWKK